MGKCTRIASWKPDESLGGEATHKLVPVTCEDEKLALRARISELEEQLGALVAVPAIVIPEGGVVTYQAPKDDSVVIQINEPVFRNINP